MLRAHLKALPTYKQLLLRMQQTDVHLTALRDATERRTGYFVTRIIQDIIIPDLEVYFARGGTLTKWEYKVIADRFTVDNFDDSTTPNEQMGLCLLDPAEKYNSVLKCRPIAFCYNEKESRELVALLLKEIEKRLPREIFSVEVLNPLTNEVVEVTLKEFKGNDVALECMICHWFINVNRNWRSCYCQKLGEQVGVDLKGEDERLMSCKRPMKGWDATASVGILKRPDHNGAVLAKHPLIKPLQVVDECLAFIGEALLKPKLREADIDAYERKVRLLGLTWRSFFSTKERCTEALAEFGLPALKLPHLRFNLGCYEHHTIAHSVPFLRENKSLIKYSSWVCEAMNKVWKTLLLEYTTYGGGHDHSDPGLEALKRMLRMTHPLFRQHSERFVMERKRRKYMCRKCEGDKEEGHWKMCPKNPKRFTERELNDALEAFRV
ncbi:hypothetical protein CYMTET_25562 [Cymbomonas tetramitiformis]|uniref:Uncharacterized protein n=1 Tax=Cymbomonas tetramitiformis TaxID=36881 RepID=A0AAE0KYU2_9CHLO|nr:hypothetical protein CYMTET_25562 [Cymbomonas tetramitiformis]